MTSKQAFSRRFTILLSSALLFSTAMIIAFTSSALSVLAWHSAGGVSDAPANAQTTDHIQLWWLQTGRTHHWHFNVHQGQFAHQPLPPALANKESATAEFRLLWLNPHVELGILRHSQDLLPLTSELETLRATGLTAQQRRWHLQLSWVHRFGVVCAISSLLLWTSVFRLRPKPR